MTLLECDLPGVRKVHSGKVREIFDLGDCLLIVATDRISAYDHILPTGIPRKGEVLTGMSAFWFEALDFVPNHFVTARFEAFPDILQPHGHLLKGRSMLVKKTKPLPVECVARGYIAGSAWREYSTSGTIAGQSIPAGITCSGRLPSPLFTPATKAVEGHDENITWKECRAILGDETAIQVRDQTLELYEHGRAIASRAGIIVADTKFEFGIIDDSVVLIDECLTPDSSRFWPSDSWTGNSNPPSFDKQFVRDHLDSIGWDHSAPAPPLPPEVVEATSRKYIEAYERITGCRLPATTGPTTAAAGG